MAGEVTSVAPRRSNTDRHKDDARPSWFEPLNDTALSTTRPGRTKRVYRKTPPPPINRHQYTVETKAAAPHHHGVSARLNRFEEPLNDTTGSKTPPPSWSNASAATLGHVDSEQAGPSDKHEQPCDAAPDLTVLCTLPGASPHEDASAALVNDFEDCDWLNKA